MESAPPFTLTPKSGKAIYERALEVLKKAQEFQYSVEVGVREAVWKPQLDYPDLPFALFLFTDPHLGSVRVDYDLLERHLALVEDTPNFGLVANGDEVDAFSAVNPKYAAGAYENPLSPQFQTLAWLDKLKRLSQKGKVGCLSFGNHNNMVSPAGYDWLESFCRDLNTRVFTSGGLLRIQVGREEYKLALTHKFWGFSKINPTLSTKRFMEYEYPEAEVLFLGHYHVSEMLFFERGGKERIGVIGGTYKLDEVWARQQGIGGRGGKPGHTVLLFPNTHKIIGFKHIEDAVMFLSSLIACQHERKAV